MKKLILLTVFVCLASLGVFVYAQTLGNILIVNTNSCSETDGGLNYYTAGSTTGSFWWPAGNSTATYNGTVTDVCISGTTLVESACGSSISASYSNVAGIVYVDCSSLSNSSNSWGCQNGRCLRIGGGGGGGGNGTNSTNSTMRADLIVSNLTYTYSLAGNTTNSTNSSYNVVISTVVKNIGNAAAGASTTRVVFSMFSGMPSGQNIPTIALNPGQQTVLQRTFSGTSGMFYVNATADYSNVVVESNEANNNLGTSGYLP